MMPLFSYLGPVDAAVATEPPAAFVANLRPRDERILVLLATDRAVLAAGLVLGHGSRAFAVVRARDPVVEVRLAPDGTVASEARVERPVYDVVHVSSGLRAWRARRLDQALRDAAFLAWLGTWDQWTEKPGERPAPPAVTAYLAAAGPREAIDSPW